MPRGQPFGDDAEDPAASGPAGSSSSSSSLPALPGISRLPKLMRGVVKVWCTHARPNFSQPWAVRPPIKSSSSGFCITSRGMRLVVTNAHSVESAIMVQVRLQGQSEKVAARVLVTAHDCDLALLAVDDASFWVGTPVLSLGPLPALHQQVVVVGSPLGGEQISITAVGDRRRSVQEASECA